jgi:DNA-binding response OmpR family regulator
VNHLVVVNSRPKTRDVNGLSDDADAPLAPVLSMSVNRVFRFSDVTVDLGRRRVTRCGEPVHLSRAEFDLLELFLHNIDWPLRRNAIMNAAWGYHFYTKSRTVDVHVARLRRKLESNPAAPCHFLTIHGVGYRFLL